MTHMLKLMTITCTHFLLDYDGYGLQVVNKNREYKKLEGLTREPR